MQSSDLGHSDILPFTDFNDAVQSVLEFLHEHIGLQLWMFTRVEGNDWIILSAKDEGYGVHAGDVFRWPDSFCSRMVCGLGPRIAPVSNDIPAYAEAPIGRQVPIGSYIGIPIYQSDGLLFGTLCAIDPHPQPDSLKTYLSLLELQSRLLTTILQAELKAQEQQRSLERLEAEAQIDSLTGIFNRRAWDRLLLLEEERCKRYGNSASIVIVDLDNLKRTNDAEGHTAGDRLIQIAAQALKESIRVNDVLARLGGDEFSVLIVELTEEDTRRFVSRLCMRLDAAGVEASVGWAIRSHSSNLTVAFEDADRAMYQNKRLRKSLLRPPHYY